MTLLPCNQCSFMVILGAFSPPSSPSQIVHRSGILEHFLFAGSSSSFPPLLLISVSVTSDPVAFWVVVGDFSPSSRFLACCHGEK